MRKTFGETDWMFPVFPVFVPTTGSLCASVDVNFRIRRRKRRRRGEEEEEEEIDVHYQPKVWTKTLI